MLLITIYYTSIKNLKKHGWGRIHKYSFLLLFLMLSWQIAIMWMPLNSKANFKDYPEWTRYTSFWYLKLPQYSNTNPLWMNLDGCKSQTSNMSLYGLQKQADLRSVCLTAYYYISIRIMKMRGRECLCLLAPATAAHSQESPVAWGNLLFLVPLLTK